MNFNIIVVAIEDSAESPWFLKFISTSFSVRQYIIIAFLATGVAWLLQYHWKRRRMFRMASKLHQVPNSLPIIGHGHYFIGSTERIFRNITMFFACDKTPLAARLGSELFVGIFKPEHMEAVMCNALEKTYHIRFTNVVIGDGLFGAPVGIWKKHRKIIMPTFNQKILDSFVEVFSENAEVMVQVIGKHLDKKDIDLFSILVNATIATICETAMGIKSEYSVDNEEPNEFGKWVSGCMNILFKRMFNLFYHPDFIFYNTPIGRKLLEYSAKVHSYSEKIVEKKKQAYFREKELLKENCEVDNAYGGTKRNAFLDLLIELSENGARFTDEELRDEVVTFMIAGSDTTAASNCFILCMLGMHQDIQDRVYEEVMDVVGPSRMIEYSDLPRLKYLERCIKETMRLFPIGPVIVRKIQEDLKFVTGETIPEGASILISIITLHRHEDYYPDPLKFDPDRFLPEEVAKRHPFAYLPFSGGPRNCIGLKYAMMAMKTLIATVLRNYKVFTHYKSVEEIQIKQDIVLKPVDGYKVHFAPRN